MLKRLIEIPYLVFKIIIITLISYISDLMQGVYLQMRKYHYGFFEGKLKRSARKIIKETHILDKQE